MELAKRVKTLTPSSTLAINAMANQLKKEGHDVISLGVGEPDFNTPDYILQAAYQAMKEGKTKYTPSGGIVELKEAIQKKLLYDNDLSYTLDEIIVTIGAKHGLYNLFQVLLDEGDEVIIPAPFWVSYPEQVKLAGGIPIIVETKEKDAFKITPKQLKEHITERTKAIILNSPSNPTGMMYHEEELEAIGEICIENNVMIVSDEIYEKLIYTEDPHISIAQISPVLKEQTIVINGVSKSHAMTGWRIGYAAGPKKIIQAMTDLASHSTSNPTSIAQYATIAAYEEKNDFVDEMNDVFSERLNTVYELISEIPGISCDKPKGAFYIFPHVKEAAKNNGYSSVDEWVKAILQEEKVALVPGSSFGAPDHVRISYATSIEALIEACKRIKRFVLNHHL